MSTKIRDQIRDDILTRISNNTIKLPSIPEIIVKINSIINDDKRGMTDIAKVIQADMSVTARLLQISNSPALRGMKEITSVSDAITRLGLNTVKDIVMCASIRDRFVSSNPSVSSILESIWEDSIGLSAYGTVVLEHLKANQIKSNTILMVGLLYNIGKLPVIEYIDKFKLTDTKEIETILESLRSELGEKILSTWDLPFEVVQAVGADGIDNKSKNVECGDIIILIKTYMAALSDPNDRNINKQSRVVKKLPITYDEFGEIVRAGESKIMEMKQILK